MMHDSPCSKKRSLNLNVNFKPGEKTPFSCINTRPSCPVLLASNYIMWRLTSFRVCPTRHVAAYLRKKKNQKDLCHNKTAAVSAEKMIFLGGIYRASAWVPQPPLRLWSQVRTNKAPRMVSVGQPHVLGSAACAQTVESRVCFQHPEPDFNSWWKSFGLWLTFETTGKASIKRSKYRRWFVENLSENTGAPRS